MIKIAILAYKDIVPSAVSGIYDVFSVANWEWSQNESLRKGAKGPLFDAQIVSETGKRVTGFNGVPVHVHAAIAELKKIDLVIVPPWLGDINVVMKKQAPVVAWLKQLHKKKTFLSAVCTGTFLLAETGLLDRREATTHWYWSEQFRERYADVLFKPDKLLIDEDQMITAAGMTAYLNLALYLVARFGSPELASICSKLLLVDSGIKLQTPYEVFRFEMGHGDEEILRSQTWMEENIKEKITVQSLAGVAGLGRRTFMRRFKEATGDSPLEYLQRKRITIAKRLLESTKDPISRITYAVGYEDSSSFQRLFKQLAGLSPGAYRKKFLMLD